MRTTTILAGLFALGLAGAATGDASRVPPPPPAAAPAAPAPKAEEEFGKLVARLADPDYRTRDAALRRLEAEGLRAIPPLRKALNHPDPEVRRRVATLLPTLETAAVLAPRRVTLKAANKPLRAVLDELQKQTGYKIECFINGRDVYSFDFADLSFWEALDRVSESAGLVYQQGYGDTTVRLQQSGAHAAHVGHRGAFRLVPTGYNQNRNVEFGLAGKGAPAGSSHESIAYNFTVFAEPKLPLLGVGPAKVDAAYDSDGGSLLPGPDGEEMVENGGMMMRGRSVSYYGGGNRSLSMQASLELRRRSSKASAVKVVRGTLPLTLLVDQKPVVVADKVLVAKGKKVKVGSTNITVHEAKETGKKQYVIRMSIQEENADPNDYSLVNSIYQRLELQDAKGHKYAYSGGSMNYTGPGSLELTQNFSTQGAPGNVGPAEKLVFQAWTTLQYRLPFEFRDLPLP